jgi:DNA-3-methyladenine glycosylase
MRLSRSFYSRDPRIVARGLLGKVLVCKSKGKTLKGRIVETEAYLGRNDPGAIGLRKTRSIPGSLLLPPGHAFVYFTYGNHWMLNVIAKKGRLGAVLIRALEPLEGLALMERRRGTCETRNLTNGPGKLTQAFGISKRHDGLDLLSGGLFIETGGGRFETVRTTRIGLSKGQEKPLRFYIRGNEFVSKK